MSALPTFLVVGAMRSGTTSLVRYLGAHPQVFVAPQKEVHFFDTRFDRGVGWYANQFEGSDGALAVGEGTPRYMYEEVAVERMAAVVPAARLLVLLRDPVERAYSHYWQNRVRGHEHRSFADAIATERDRPGRFGRAYIDAGRYLPQLERLCRYFPREQVHVALFDDLRDRPEETFAAAAQFIGVDRTVPELVGEPLNQFQQFRSLTARRLGRRLPARLKNAVGRINKIDAEYPPMDPAIAAELAAGFAAGNAALAEWLGLDLSAWSA